MGDPPLPAKPPVHPAAGDRALRKPTSERVPRLLDRRDAAARCCRAMPRYLYLWRLTETSTGHPDPEERACAYPNLRMNRLLVVAVIPKSARARTRTQEPRVTQAASDPDERARAYPNGVGRAIAERLELLCMT